MKSLAVCGSEKDTHMYWLVWVEWKNTLKQFTGQNINYMIVYLEVYYGFYIASEMVVSVGRKIVSLVGRR